MRKIDLLRARYQGTMINFCEFSAGENSVTRNNWSRWFWFSIGGIALDRFEWYVLFMFDLKLFNQNRPFSILSLKEYGVIIYTNLNTVVGRFPHFRRNKSKINLICDCDMCVTCEAPAMCSPLCVGAQKRPKMSRKSDNTQWLTSVDKEEQSNL